MNAEEPADSWRNRVTGTAAGYVDQLAGADLLTEKQALAYVLRDVYGIPRDDAAADMGVTASTLDKHLSAAREKLDEARTTIDHVDRIEREGVPTPSDESDESDEEGL